MKYRHVLVPPEFVHAERYTSPPVNGGGGDPIPARPRAAHANRLLGELQQIAAEASVAIATTRALAGVEQPGGYYVQVEGLPDYALHFESLAAERSGVALLNTKKTETGDVATVFIPEQKLETLERKISSYRDENFGQTENPKNQRLVASIESISLAHVTALWTDDPATLPVDPNERFWAEVWLRTEDDVSRDDDEIARRLAFVGLQRGIGAIEFPERRVIPVFGSRIEFDSAMFLLNSIAELRKAKTAAPFFHAETPDWQNQWVDSLAERIVAAPEDAPRLCLLDTGLNDHPLLVPLIATHGKQTIEPSWGVADQNGHGTNMAGLCMFGDLADALLTAGPFHVGHRLESVKLLRHAGDNQGRLLGDITGEGVARAEVQAPNANRAFVMALSATDTRDRGKPTTWSAMLDKLASGADDDETRRLFIVSGGNVRRHDWEHYPDSNTSEGIHDPGQSWNALTVGAYTEKDELDAATYPDWSLLAPRGDLSPSSSTSATWSTWPVKPDVVFEGGNAARDPAGSIDTVPSLDLLTTNHQFIARPLQLFGDTSAASALAGRFAAQLSASYPEFWPETIRGLMVHSAEWTPAMLDRFVASDAWSATKGDVRNLMRHCGHGVPNMDVAVWSASSELTLVSQAELQPFDERLDATGKRNGFTTKDMHLHHIPWPQEVLEELGATEVELRVTLSYFIEPNPAERGWAGRYRYQSHGLRFAAKKGTESIDQFRHRVNGYARAQEGGTGGTDSQGWLVGETTRNLGSIHSDRWRGTAAALAERGVLAVYPTIGWWRERPKHERWDRKARYSLIVSIHAPAVDVDLYTEVANRVGIQVAVPAT